MSKKKEALRTMRELLRSAQEAFRGDSFALRGAKVEIRKHYEKDRRLRGTEEVEKAIRSGREAARFLRENVLQGKMNVRGNFETTIREADPLKREESWEKVER